MYFFEKKVPIIIHVFGLDLILGSKNAILKVKIAKKFLYISEVRKIYNFYPKNGLFDPKIMILKISDHFRSDRPKYDLRSDQDHIFKI